MDDDDDEEGEAVKEEEEEEEGEVEEDSAAEARCALNLDARRTTSRTCDLTALDSFCNTMGS